MKFCIVGNCQARGMARCFDMLVPNSTTVVFLLGQIYNERDPKRLEKWAASVSDFDAVFMINYIDTTKAGPFAPDKLSSSCKLLVRYPYIAFMGLHPDCTYICHDNTLLQSPMGPYHSALTAAAYLEKLSTRRTIKLFNTFTYAELGYFAAYDVAVRSLCHSSEALGYSFSSFVDPQSRSGFMHTINHPNIQIIEEMAFQALKKAGLELDRSPSSVHDELNESVVWPIYPELACRIGLKGSHDFRPGPNNVMSLEYFVERSYEAYAYGPSDFSAASVETARAFIRNRVRK